MGRKGVQVYRMSDYRCSNTSFFGVARKNSPAFFFLAASAAPSSSFPAFSSLFDPFYVFFLLGVEVFGFVEGNFDNDRVVIREALSALREIVNFMKNFAKVRSKTVRFTGHAGPGRSLSRRIVAFDENPIQPLPT